MTSGEGSSFSRSSTGLTVRAGSCERASSAATRSSPGSLRSSAIVVSRSRTMVPCGSARSPRAARAAARRTAASAAPSPWTTGSTVRGSGIASSALQQRRMLGGGRLCRERVEDLPHGARPDHREARNRRVAPRGLVGTVGGQVRDEPLHFLACRSSDRHVRVSRIDGEESPARSVVRRPAFLAEHPGDDDAEQVERDHRARPSASGSRRRSTA